MVFQSLQCMSGVWHGKNNEKFQIFNIIHVFTSQNLLLTIKHVKLNISYDNKTLEVV
jgi:hypothetical protein